MTVTSRNVTIRDFVIFQVKLVLDGTKDFVAFWLSIFAITLDFVSGRGKRPRLFYSVVRASERFDKWINLHSVLEEMDGGGDSQGLLSGTEGAPDNFLADIERLVRGSEEDRAKAIDMLKEKGGELRRRMRDERPDPDEL